MCYIPCDISSRTCCCRPLFYGRAGRKDEAEVDMIDRLNQINLAIFFILISHNGDELIIVTV